MMVVVIAVNTLWRHNLQDRSLSKIGFNV